jgi:cell division protein ZapA (FtsZ GTPase activity inhibitor)
MTDQKRSVSVWIRGQEFRIRSDEDQESLQRVARYLDETMQKVEQRTGTADSLDVALLTALNLARELVSIREGRLDAGTLGLDRGRLRSIIELAESALPAEAG